MTPTIAQQYIAVLKQTGFRNDIAGPEFLAEHSHIDLGDGLIFNDWSTASINPDHTAVTTQDTSVTATNIHLKENPSLPEEWTFTTEKRGLVTLAFTTNNKDYELQSNGSLLNSTDNTLHANKSEVSAILNDAGLNHEALTQYVKREENQLKREQGLDAFSRFKALGKKLFTGSDLDRT